MSALVVPAFTRGETIATDLVTYGGRDGEAQFQAPSVESLLEWLPQCDPGKLSELYTLSVEDIIDYLAELGQHLVLDRNEFLQQALEQSVPFSDMTAPLVRFSFEQMPSLFAPDAVREVAERTIGIRYLDGFHETEMSDGRLAAVRAMGSRAVHIIAGNSPMIAAVTIIRNAITRSDAIIKTPSSDPLTALAIARTMGRFAPDHPLTRHLAVAYWKGGDATLEQQLYDPAHVEKILAWGGLASVRHVTRYIQPGLELISLDPKRSATVIGEQAFESSATLDEVSRRAATDIGALNQLACVSARVIYVQSGTDADGLARANDLGRRIYEHLQALPEAISTPARRFDHQLKANLDALRSTDDWYRVYGGEAGEGAVIVSQLDEAVDFSASLSGRVANLVPIDDIGAVVRAMTSYTQTVGIYPESLKRQLREVLPLYGAQRLVSLGYAAHGNTALPQDAIEPVRRMVKWIVEETCDPSSVPPLWRVGDAAQSTELATSAGLGVP
jgi:hypothetical protein